MVKILNKGNPLSHGDIFVKSGEIVDVADEVVKLWVKMGMKIEVLSELKEDNELSPKKAKKGKNKTKQETEASVELN